MALANFQRISFDEANPFLTGVNKSLSTMQSAFQTALMAPVAQQEMERNRLANELKQNELQFAPETSRAELAYKQAQTPYLQAQTEGQRFKLSNPLLDQPGVAGQVGSLLYAKQKYPELFEKGAQQEGIPSPLAAALKSDSQVRQEVGQPLSQPSRAPQLQQAGTLGDVFSQSIFSDVSRKQAVADLMNQRTKAFAWSNLPIDSKRVSLAQAKGFGYTEGEASKLFNEGYDVRQLAVAKGLSENPQEWPQPKFAPTQTTLTRNQQSNVANAGLDAIEPIITSAIKPYAARYKGYSPKQIVDALKGQNEDRQAKYLAANAMQPEVAALRIKAAQGTLGLHAIENMIDRSQGKIKNFESLVTPRVLEKMNVYLRQWIRQMNRAENQTALKYQDEEDTGKLDLPNTTETKAQDYSHLSDEELMRIGGEQ